MGAQHLSRCTILVLGVLMIMAIEEAHTEGAPGANCSSQCGGIKVPYPFGIRDDGEDCYLRSSFNLTCNKSFNPPKLFRGPFEVTDISLPYARMRVLMYISYMCYNTSGVQNDFTWSVRSSSSTYALSSTENVFTAVGCDTIAFFDIGNNNTGGCYSGCNDMQFVEDGKCSGIGCCQASLPGGLHMLNTSFDSYDKHRRILGFNPCSYSFLVERNNYTFRKSDLNHMDENRLFPMIVDWYAGNQTCQQAKENLTGYACVSSNSVCLDSSTGLGYICKCSRGYQGNPYLSDGCQDIDECKLDRAQYPCQGVCTNTPGGYNCSCTEGSYSDDPKTQKCVKKEGISLAFKLVIGIGSGLFFLFAASFFCYFHIQERKIVKLRQKYFEHNGGSHLERIISLHPSSAFKIFKMVELEYATNNFDMDRILGRGGFGSVYKGIMDDNRVVAIKKSLMIDEKRGKEFANEMLILSQINHKNIVKLLGCCLEIEVPILAYEYIPNGTLFNYIHSKKYPISFNIRLKIATEVAEALRYLHNDASPPILHGDVKSSNILLDENYTAKVSDFGTSTLAPKDKSQFTTLVQGTYGYLDPEYLQTSHLTDKSDVYSFGVVLVELLTRKMPFYFEGSEEDRSLAFNFISCMNEKRLIEILDPEVAEEGLTYEVIKVANIAMQCLNVKGDERPTMKAIVMELEELRGIANHPWVSTGPETETFLGESSTYNHDISVQKHVVFDIEGGR